jgi:Icc-related predicted phosphoesterase
MVKIQIMSDVHIETSDKEININDYIKPSADILILAGDIGRIYKLEQLTSFIKQLSQKFKILIYVPGNQEYYKVQNCEPKSIDELLADLKELTKIIPNLYILNRDKLILYEDICIAGCTLWSHSNEDIPYKMIRIHGINRYIYNMLYQQDLEFIKHSIKFCKEKGYKLVVVTHYCPTFLVAKNKEPNIRHLYASALDHLLLSTNMHTWICGHVHHNFDLVKNGVHLVSNQKGKPKENIQDFILNKVLEIV